MCCHCFVQRLFSGGLQVAGHLTCSLASSLAPTSTLMWQSPDETRPPRADTFRDGNLGMLFQAAMTLLHTSLGRLGRRSTLKFTAVGRERVLIHHGGSSSCCTKLSRRSGHSAIVPQCGIRWRASEAAPPIASVICSLRLHYSTRQRDYGIWMRQIFGEFCHVFLPNSEDRKSVV